MCILQMQRLIIEVGEERLSYLEVFQALTLLMRSDMRASEENKDPFYVALYIILFSFPYEGTEFEQKSSRLYTQTPHFI